MDSDQNNKGSNQVLDFRRFRKHYKLRVKWVRERTVPMITNPATGEVTCPDLEVGDTYYVKFNFDQFNPNNAADVTFRAQVSPSRANGRGKANLSHRKFDYADPQGSFRCRNDGFQFHL
jgi:hypothetical protein